MRFCWGDLRGDLSAAKMVNQIIDRGGCSIWAAVRMPRGILPAGGGKRRVRGTGGFAVLECSLLSHDRDVRMFSDFCGDGRAYIYDCSVRCY